MKKTINKGKIMLNPFQKMLRSVVMLTLITSPLWAQYIQNPSTGSYGITETTATDSNVFLKNTTSAGIARWMSVGGNGAVNAQVIADPTTGLARFGTTVSGIDVDVFSPRNIFLSTDPGTGVTPRFTVKQNGYIGINTITPQKSVDIQSVSNDVISVGKPLAVGEWTGIHIGYAEPWNTYYRKAGFGFYRTDATASRGKLFLFNNVNSDASSGTVNDARLTVDESGKVGIGTVSPRDMLEVFGGLLIQNNSGTNGLRVQRGSDTSAPTVQIAMDSGSSYISSWGPMVFQTGAFSGTVGERVRIAPDGKVGIGQNNPSKTLDVNGTLGVSGQTTLSSTDVMGMAWVRSGDLRVGEGIASPSIRWSGPNNWDAYLGTSQDKLYFRRNSDPKVTIQSDGSVGIGISNPSSTLHLDVAGGPVLRMSRGNGSRFDIEVDGTNMMIGPRDSGDLILKSGSYGEGLRLLANGNVGIGTTTPTSKFELSDTINNETALHINARGINSNVPLIRFSQNNTKKWSLFAEYPAAGNFSLYSHGGVNDVVMIVKDNGNVGIGTSTPSTKLEVNGTVRAQDMIVVVKNWADYVFEPDYKLRTLPELETFIKSKKHLPDVPTEAEVKAKGANVGEVQVALLRKIEELSLYVIECQKKLVKTEEKLDKTEETLKTSTQEIETLKARLEKLESAKRVGGN